MSSTDKLITLNSGRATVEVGRYHGQYDGFCQNPQIRKVQHLHRADNHINHTNPESSSDQRSAHKLLICIYNPGAGSILLLFPSLSPFRSHLPA